MGAGAFLADSCGPGVCYLSPDAEVVAMTAAQWLLKPKVSCLSLHKHLPYADTQNYSHRRDSSL